MPLSQLLSTVIDSSGDGILVIDHAGTVQFANPAAAGMFAGKTNQLVGFHLGVPSSREPVEMVLPQEGFVRYVEMRATDIAWNNSIATVANLRDITERKQTDETLRAQAEDLLRQNSHLMRLNSAFIGRELRMIELKKEVNDLCRRLNEPPRHRIPLVESVPDPAQTSTRI